jgi:hypothetical protein
VRPAKGDKMRLSCLRKWRYSPCGDIQIFSQEYLRNRERVRQEFIQCRPPRRLKMAIGSEFGLWKLGLLLGSALADAVLLNMIRQERLKEMPIYFYDSDLDPTERPSYGSDNPEDDDPAIWMPAGEFDIEEPGWFLHEIKHAIDDARGRLDVDPRLRGRSNEEVASEEYKKLWRKDRGERRAEMFMKRHLIRTGNLKPRETK